MTIVYLLDTNIVSDLVRHPEGRVAQRITEVGEGAVAVSIIAAAELRYGAAKKRSPRVTTQLDKVLRALTSLPFEPPADRCYGELRATLQARGAPIGPNDLLIAAQALAIGAILVTDNMRELARVDGLKVENWLR